MLALPYSASASSCACAQSPTASIYTKLKNTKIYSKGILVNHTKISTNENFPLYGSLVSRPSHVLQHQLLVHMPNWPTYTSKKQYTVVNRSFHHSGIPPFHHSTMFHSIVPLLHSTVPRSIESTLPFFASTIRNQLKRGLKGHFQTIFGNMH